LNETEHPDAVKDAYYLAFTADTDPAAAMERFAQKYAEAPRCSFVSRGNLLVGPIPEHATRNGGRN